MLQIALCDDETEELDLLGGMIAEYAHRNGLEATADSFQDGKSLLQSAKKFDVIFLDIQMGEENGIEIAKQIRESNKQVKIIYVTNFSGYQADAFSVRAFGYVEKPVAYDTIAKQLDDVFAYMRTEDTPAEFTFNTSEGFKTLKLADIYYFESSNRKVRVVTRKKTYLIAESLLHIFSNFQPYGFSTPHKSFVINLMHVSSIKGYDILMKDGVRIPISQKRAVKFKAEFHSFLRNNFNLLTKG